MLIGGAMQDVLEISGCDRINPNAALRPLDSHDPSELIDPALRCGIDREPVNSDNGADRRIFYDPAAAA